MSTAEWVGDAIREFFCVRRTVNESEGGRFCVNVSLRSPDKELVLSLYVALHISGSGHQATRRCVLYGVSHP